MKIKLRNVSWCQLKSQMTEKLTIVIYMTVKHKSISPELQTPTHSLSLCHIIYTFCAIATRKITEGKTIENIFYKS